MIYLQLFLNFLMIGALSFGGGYGMISLVRETVLRYGWLTEAEFLSFIAVSESTPGPLAVNMATFIGSSQGREASVCVPYRPVSLCLCCGAYCGQFHAPADEDDDRRRFDRMQAEVRRGLYGIP